MWNAIRDRAWQLKSSRRGGLLGSRLLLFCPLSNRIFRRPDVYAVESRCSRRLIGAYFIRTPGVTAHLYFRLFFSNFCLCISIVVTDYWNLTLYGCLRRAIVFLDTTCVRCFCIPGFRLVVYVRLADTHRP